MNKLMKGIGAFILACIAVAVPMLTPISIMLGWNPRISFFLGWVTFCELMCLFAILYILYREDAE